MLDERPSIFIAYPYHFSTADYRGAFSGVEEDFGDVRFVYADEQITNKHILDKITTMMGAAAFSLFDITTWNPNVALELGIAIGRGLDYYILFNPTVEASDVPADLGGIDRIQYEDYTALKIGVAKLMRQQFGSPEPEVEETKAGAEIVERMETLADAVPGIVKAEPGLLMGGIASSLGVPVEVAQLVVRPLVGDKLVTRGERRGARYYAPEDAPTLESNEESTTDRRMSYSIKTPEGNSGPFDEDELRAKLRAYREERGEDATVRDVAVFEIDDRSTAGGRLDVRQFL